MPKSERRPKAVLHMKNLQVLGKFIEKMRAISAEMADNVTFFPSPVPILTTFNTDITNLETAENNAKSRKAGLVAIRDQKYAIVLEDVHSLQNYVQNIADAASNEEGAITIITASGFDLRHSTAREKPDFAVKYGKLSGSVILIAKAKGARSANEWEMSDNGTAWTSLPSTTKARTTVTGLPVNVLKYFRHRSLTKDGEGNWSLPASIIII